MIYKSKKLLNIDNNPKTVKGQSKKVMTAILYFAPAKISGFNVCPFAGLIETYPTAQWYDYTKNPIRMKKFIAGKFPKNYHLTFSLGSSNKSDAKEILKLGGNVAVVFRNKKLPKKFMGHKVFNADKTDLRFKDPKNIIAGLYAKGKARYDDTGFVQDV